MIKKIVNVLTKNKMIKLLRPNSQYMTKIKNFKVRLYSRPFKKDDPTKRFWEIEVKV